MPELRLAELWDAIKVRLDSAEMQTILGGAGRVRLRTENYGPEGAEDEEWGRLLILPSQRLWPESGAGLDMTRQVALVVRAEFNDFRGEGYDPGRATDAAMAEVFDLLENWLPPAGVYMRPALSCYQWTPPLPLPILDGETGLWTNSAEYRTEVVPP